MATLIERPVERHREGPGGGDQLGGANLVYILLRP